MNVVGVAASPRRPCSEGGQLVDATEYEGYAKRETLG
jgi:hypothetical protein